MFVAIVRKHEEVKGEEGPLYSIILDETTLLAIVGGWGPSSLDNINRELARKRLPLITNTDSCNLYYELINVLKEL